MSEPDATQTDDAVELPQPIPASAEHGIEPPTEEERELLRKLRQRGAEHSRRRRSARRRGELIVPLDEDQDQRQDTGWYDPDGPEGPIPSREVPLVAVQDPDGEGSYKMAVVDYIPPKPKTAQDILASKDVYWARKLAAVEARWKKWFWSLFSLSGFASLAAIIYYIVFIAGALVGPLGPSHSERALRDAINTPGSWIDSCHPEEQAELVRAVQQDAAERGED